MLFEIGLKTSLKPRDPGLLPQKIKDKVARLCDKLENDRLLRKAIRKGVQLSGVPDIGVPTLASPWVRLRTLCTTLEEAGIVVNLEQEGRCGEGHGQEEEVVYEEVVYGEMECEGVGQEQFVANILKQVVNWQDQEPEPPMVTPEKRPLEEEEPTCPKLLRGARCKTWRSRRNEDQEQAKMALFLSDEEEERGGQQDLSLVLQEVSMEEEAGRGLARVEEEHAYFRRPTLTSELSVEQAVRADQVVVGLQEQELLAKENAVAGVRVDVDGSQEDWWQKQASSFKNIASQSCKLVLQEKQEVTTGQAVVGSQEQESLAEEQTIAADDDVGREEGEGRASPFYLTARPKKAEQHPGIVLQEEEQESASGDREVEGDIRLPEFLRDIGEEQQRVWEGQDYLDRAGLGGLSTQEVVVWLENLGEEAGAQLKNSFIQQLLHHHRPQVDSSLIGYMWKVQGIHDSWISWRLRATYVKYLDATLGKYREQLAKDPDSPWWYLLRVQPGGDLHRPNHLHPACAAEPFPRLANWLKNLGEQERVCEGCGRLGFLPICGCLQVFYCGEECREEDVDHVRDCSRLEVEAKRGAMLLSHGMVSHRNRANRLQCVLREVATRTEQEQVERVRLRGEVEQLKKVVRKRQSQLQILNTERLATFRRSLAPPSSAVRTRGRGRGRVRQSRQLCIEVVEGEKVVRVTSQTTGRLNLLAGTVVREQRPITAACPAPALAALTGDSAPTLDQSLSTTGDNVQVIPVQPQKDVHLRNESCPNFWIREDSGLK